MVKLRLSRIGKSKQPYYRIVAMNVSSARNGRALAYLGTYDPLHSSVKIDEEHALQWLNNGAQMTETVKALFDSQGLLARWKGLEGTVREDALTRDKPKRRRKLAAQSGEPAVAEAPAEEAAEVPAEKAPEASAEEAADAPAEEATEAPAEAPVEGAAEEAAEAPAEETAEEAADAPAEETAEAPAEEATEAPAEETAEAPAEETAEEGDKKE